MLTQRSYLELVVEEALAYLDEQKHRDFEKALRMSIKTDLDTLDAQSRDDESAAIPNLCTAQDITRLNFSLEDQKALRISLTKAQAFDFISTFKPIKESRFKNEFNFGSYVEFFGKEPVSLYGKRRVMLLTYAEWVHFCGIGVEPKMPTVK